jgi:hypothetical protein
MGDQVFPSSGKNTTLDHEEQNQATENDNIACAG